MTDAEWRIAGITRWRPVCRNCGFSSAGKTFPGLQGDHLIPRSQGGRNDVENLLVLCAPFIPGIAQNYPRRPAGGCHMAVTEAKLLRNVEWLEPEQLEYLAREGWLSIHPCGEARGKGIDYFAL